MLLVCRNYHCVSTRYPEGCGMYSYVKNIFGYDRAFLISWFVFLLYISIFWANATAVPLFPRYIFGDIFRLKHVLWRLRMFTTLWFPSAFTKKK